MKPQVIHESEGVEVVKPQNYISPRQRLLRIAALTAFLAVATPVVILGRLLYGKRSSDDDEGESY